MIKNHTVQSYSCNSDVFEKIKSHWIINCTSFIWFQMSNIESIERDKLNTEVKGASSVWRSSQLRFSLLAASCSSLRRSWGLRLRQRTLPTSGKLSVSHPQSEEEEEQKEALIDIPAKRVQRGDRGLMLSSSSDMETKSPPSPHYRPPHPQWKQVKANFNYLMTFSIWVSNRKTTIYSFTNCIYTTCVSLPFGSENFCVKITTWSICQKQPLSHSYTGNKTLKYAWAATSNSPHYFSHPSSAMTGDDHKMAAEQRCSCSVALPDVSKLLQCDILSLNTAELEITEVH